MYRNNEHYPDPTFGTAYANIKKEMIECLDQPVSASTAWLISLTVMGWLCAHRHCISRHSTSVKAGASLI